MADNVSVYVVIAGLDRSDIVVAVYPCDPVGLRRAKSKARWIAKDWQRVRSHAQEVAGVLQSVGVFSVDEEGAFKVFDTEGD